MKEWHSEELSDSNTCHRFVLASLLFNIFFSVLILVVFKDCDLGVLIQFRTDETEFSLLRLQARTKVFSAVIPDLLLSYDCALEAHTHTQDSAL